MHDITYTTSSGRTYDLQSARALLTSSSTSLRGWGWTVDSTTGTATRAAREYTANVYFEDQDEANAFLRDTDMDEEEGYEGVLEYDGWQLSCSVVSGTAKDWIDSHLEYDLTLRASEPVWRKVTEHSFTVAAGSDEGESLDYPHGYDFDYDSPSAGIGGRTITIATRCLIGVRFFGPCTNPYVRVSALLSDGTTKTNVYGVDASCSDGERIVIDPLGKGTVGGSVYKVGVTGERTNLFASRRRGTRGSGSYVFEEMPVGILTVSWPQTYGIDVLTIQERGAMPWT